MQNIFNKQNPLNAFGQVPIGAYQLMGSGSDVTAPLRGVLAGQQAIQAQREIDAQKQAYIQQQLDEQRELEQKQLDVENRKAQSILDAQIRAGTSMIKDDVAKEWGIVNKEQFVSDFLANPKNQLTDLTQLKTTKPTVPQGIDSAIAKDTMGAAWVYGLDVNDPVERKAAVEFAEKYKREGAVEKANASIYAERIKGLDEEAKTSRASRKNVMLLSGIVDRELMNVGGVENFVKKYTLWMGPQSNILQATTTLLQAAGWDVNDDNARAFLAAIQQLNTDEALMAMSQLGGNDSNEELKRVTAKFASITDYGPRAFIAKLELMKLESDMFHARVISERAALQRYGVNFDADEFERGWTKTKNAMVKEWLDKNEKLFTSSSTTEESPYAKAWGG